MSLDSHTITIDESQRQMTLLALAILALQRPGWNMALNEIAQKMDNVAPDGTCQMFEDFKKYNADRQKPI